MNYIENKFIWGDGLNINYFVYIFWIKNVLIFLKYRKNLKIANYILEDTPKVKEVIKIETQMKVLKKADIKKLKNKDRLARK